MPLKIYVASSWRNEERQQAVVKALREAGHSVYDFRHPAPGDTGFSWKQVVGKDQNCDVCHYAMADGRCSCGWQLKDPKTFRDEVLTHPIAQAAFAKDMNALREADACVLVLPCGRSAHLELGWAQGFIDGWNACARDERVDNLCTRHTYVLMDKIVDEPELMYIMCGLGNVCTSIEEVLLGLRGQTSPSPGIVKAMAGGDRDFSGDPPT